MIDHFLEFINFINFILDIKAFSKLEAGKSLTHRMKNDKYQTVKTVPKSNKKFIVTGKINTPKAKLKKYVWFRLPYLP